MSVQIIVPFASANPYRIRAAGAVVGWLQRNHPDFPLVVAAGVYQTGTGPIQFDKAAAVNRAARRSTADILILNDADTIVRPFAIHEAIRAVEHGTFEWCFAYTTYCRLGRLRSAQFCSDQLHSDPFVGPFDRELVNAPAQAVFAIRRETFLAVGGYHEGFQGSWYEDLDFMAQLEMFEIPGRRIYGEAIHLWHGERRADDSPADIAADLVAANLALWQRRQSERERLVDECA